uniref:Uncharacterized protein n=1 Tax=Rhizophora mucronata TaxID=61149 RepID=A0A2P2QHA4_RHIMU
MDQIPALEKMVIVKRKKKGLGKWKKWQGNYLRMPKQQVHWKATSTM